MMIWECWAKLTVIKVCAALVPKGSSLWDDPYKADYWLH